MTSPARASPPFPDELRAKYAGRTLLIVGSAPNLFADHDTASRIRPMAHTLLLNEAAGALPLAEHVYGGHQWKLPRFLAYRAERFPEAPPVLTHACEDGTGERPPGCDHLWRGVASGATSAWTAVRIARAMGYTEIILCGCPLDPTGYFNPEDTHRFSHDCKRVGLHPESGLVMKYRSQFAINAKAEGQGVYSMSGYTLSQLGPPPLTRP